MISIDFASCSVTLESLEFNYFGDHLVWSQKEKDEFDNFYDSIKNLHNLRNLTLIETYNFKAFLKPAQSLKNLRLKEYSFLIYIVLILIII